MASFCTTFHCMLKNNIKHTYYGKPIALEYRGGSEYPNLEQMRRVQEDRALKQRVLRGKTTVYRNYSIPAAPAFRQLPPDVVEDITERLRRSTVASEGPGCSADDRQMDAVRKNTPKFMGLRRVSAEEREDINQRLSTLTHVAKLRAERDPYKQALFINCVIPSDSLLIKRHKQQRKLRQK